MGLLIVSASCSNSHTAELIDPAPIDIDPTADSPSGLAFDGVDTSDYGLKLAMEKPATIDPAEVSLVDQSAVIVSDLVYDGLVEAAGTEGRLRPQLATEWEHAGNFSNWTFTLDTGRVTPQAVKESFERLVAASPDSAPVAMLDEVLGAAEVRAGIVSEITGITVVDESTVRIRLVRPDAGFPWLLSGVNYSIVGPGGMPTGAYSVRVDDGSNLLLHSATKPDIAITWAAGPAAAQQLFDDGTVDGAIVEVAPDGVGRSIVRFFALNTLAPDLSELDVRKAVIAAIDTSVLLAETQSALLPVDGAAAVGLAGWQANACAASCDFNPSMAETLTAVQGAAPELTIGYVGDNDQAIADAISEALLAAGFRIQVVRYSADELAAGIAKGEAEIFTFGWAAPGHSVDTVIRALFSSRSELNVARFSSSDVDELLAAASGVADDTLRWALLQQAHTMALKQAVLLPIGSVRNQLVLDDATTNVAVRADGSLEVNGDR